MEDLNGCFGCNELLHPDNAPAEVYGEGYICNSCLDEGEYRYAEDMESCYVFHIGELYWCDAAEEYYYHEENVESGNGNGLPYNANVLDHKGYSAATMQGKTMKLQELSKATKSDLFGVELELDARGDGHDIHDAWEMTRICDYSILKQDGSINGLELVTLPGTLSAHQRGMGWDKLCEAMRPVARGHHGRGNGIHVHCNRRSISPLTLGKLLVFLNKSEHREFLTVVAQREVNSHSQWCQTHPESFEKIGDSGKNPHKHGKYSALNVTHTTLEFRIFNASLLPDRILKNVEFCAALIEYCRNESARYLGIARFLEFVEMNRAIYPALQQFIVDRISGTVLIQDKLAA
jgi:hypothetical protein